VHGEGESGAGAVQLFADLEAPELVFPAPFLGFGAGRCGAVDALGVGCCAVPLVGGCAWVLR
jgi:hypothetical protein